MLDKLVDDNDKDEANDDARQARLDRQRTHDFQPDPGKATRNQYCANDGNPDT